MMVVKEKRERREKRERKNECYIHSRLILFQLYVQIVLHNIMALCKAKLNRNSLAVFLLDTACRSTIHKCTGIDQSLCLTPLTEHSTTHLLSTPAGTDKNSLVTSGKMTHVLDTHPVKFVQYFTHL